MDALPDALAGLGNYRQFILWKFSSKPGPDGKLIKLPVSPHDGLVCDAHDVAQHVTVAEALESGARLGMEIAFVFTANDPYWFLDLDGCRGDDGSWNPGTEDLQAIYNSLPGAGVEVSSSGHGYHLFGHGTVPEDHRTRPVKGTCTPFEFYTSGRFCALTGLGTIGNVDTDHTPAVQALYTSRLVPIAAEFQWEGQRDPTWRGPEDDEALIERMLASKPSAASVFDGAASLKHLWEGDEEALAKSYPPNDADIYNRSEADMALCTHLAWWTGRDGARMDRLFRESALYRDKWERGDYVEKTISGACGICADVYRQPLAPPVPQAEAAGVPLPGTAAIVSSDQLEAVFAGCAWVTSANKVWVPKYGLCHAETFRVLYGNREYTLTPDGSKTASDAMKAYRESECYKPTIVHATRFMPDKDPGCIWDFQGFQFVNTYRPLPIESRSGDITLFEMHLAKLLPNDHDRHILLSYMAALVQYPGIKFQWAPLIQGAEGNGKTFLLAMLEQTIGEHYTHYPNASDLGNKFNQWMRDKIFIGVEEIYTKERREIQEHLKDRITNRRLEIQGKGANQVTDTVCANFIFLSNHKEALLINDDGRRYAVFFTAQQSALDITRDGMGGDYFTRLWGWARTGGYAFMAHYLQNYPIPDALNPAKDLQRAPDTSSTAEAIAASLGGVEQEIMEAVAEERYGFRGGWICSFEVSLIFAARRIGPVMHGRILKSLGYIPHPSLPEGRSNRVLGRGRPRLYVHHASSMATVVHDDVVDFYEKCQQSPEPPAPPVPKVWTH